MKDKKFLIENGIDIETSLTLFGDMETYNETLMDFSEIIDAKLSEIMKYKELSDMPNYAIFLHSLKSDAKYLGFKKLAVMAEDHEFESKKNNINFVTENYDELMAEVERIINTIKEYFGLAKVQLKKETKPELPTDKIILIIDDSNLITNFVKKVLGGGNNVVCVSNGVQGVAAINKYRTAIAGILLDLNMPNLNGFELLDILKTDNVLKKIPVSIITGETNPASFEKLKNYNIMDILVKPFNERDIKLLVEQMLD